MAMRNTGAIDLRLYNKWWLTSGGKCGVANPGGRARKHWFKQPPQSPVPQLRNIGLEATRAVLLLALGCRISLPLYCEGMLNNYYGRIQSSSSYETIYCEQETYVETRIPSLQRYWEGYFPDDSCF